MRVGRKTRRAHDTDFPLDKIAPVLSHCVGLVHAPSRLKTGALFLEPEFRMMGAPSFSPYRSTAFAISLHPR
jgi:hypothetical protein